VRSALSPPSMPSTHLLSLSPELLNYIIILAVLDGSETAVIKGPVHERGDFGEKQLFANPASPGLAHACDVLKALVFPVYFGLSKFALLVAARSARLA
jgi:hypothetical protein